MKTILLLTLILVPIAVSAQTSKKPTCPQLPAKNEKAVSETNAFEFREAIVSDLYLLMDNIATTLAKHPTLKAVIVTCGETEREIAIRMRRMDVFIERRGYDPRRMELNEGGYEERTRTVVTFEPIKPPRNPGEPLKKPVLLNEFGYIPIGDFRLRLDSLFTALQANPTSYALIINSGTPSFVRARTKIMRDHIRLRYYDPDRVVFLNGLKGRKNKWTVFWLMPDRTKAVSGDRNVPERFDEFGKIANGDIKMRLDYVMFNGLKRPKTKAVIITYGSPRSVKSRILLMDAYIKQRGFARSRISLQDGGREDSIRSVMFVIPNKSILPVKSVLKTKPTPRSSQ